MIDGCLDVHLRPSDSGCSFQSLKVIVYGKGRVGLAVGATSAIFPLRVEVGQYVAKY